MEPRTHTDRYAVGLETHPVNEDGGGCGSLLSMRVKNDVCHHLRPTRVLEMSFFFLPFTTTAEFCYIKITPNFNNTVDK